MGIVNRPESVVTRMRRLEGAVESNGRSGTVGGAVLAGQNVRVKLPGEDGQVVTTIGQLRIGERDAYGILATTPAGVPVMWAYTFLDDGTTSVGPPDPPPYVPPPPPPPPEPYVPPPPAVPALTSFVGAAPNWTALGGSSGTAAQMGWRQDPRSKMITLEGGFRTSVAVTAGSTGAASLLAALPAAIAPTVRQMFMVPGGTSSGVFRVDVFADGQVRTYTPAMVATDYVSLSGISFYPAS